MPPLAWLAACEAEAPTDDAAAPTLEAADEAAAAPAPTAAAPPAAKPPSKDLPLPISAVTSAGNTDGTEGDKGQIANCCKGKTDSKEWPYFASCHHVDNHGKTYGNNHTTADCHTA